MSLIGTAAPDSQETAFAARTKSAFIAIRHIDASRDVALQGALELGLPRSIPQTWPTRSPPLAGLGDLPPPASFGSRFGEESEGLRVAFLKGHIASSVTEPRSQETEFHHKPQQRSENLDSLSSDESACFLFLFMIECRRSDSRMTHRIFPKPLDHSSNVLVSAKFVESRNVWGTGLFFFFFSSFELCPQFLFHFVERLRYRHRWCNTYNVGEKF